MATPEHVADVSVVTANYNNARYLETFFRSFNQSTYYPREIIFVDDGSSDDSVNIVRSLAPASVKLISLGTNVGFGNALNEGVRHVSSKYILRVDPDDFVAPSRIEEQFKFLEENPDVDVVGSNCYYLNETTKAVCGRSNVTEDHEEIVSLIRRGLHGMIHGSIMCRAEVLRRVSYIQSNVPVEEYDIFARMILQGFRLHNLAGCLLTYRIHAGGASSAMPYANMKRLARLKELYFGTRTTSWELLRNYIFLRSIRLYLSETNALKKYMHLAVCAIVQPWRVVSRMTARSK